MEICVKYLLKRKRLGKREERAVVLASDLIKHKREVEKLINRSKNRMAKLLNLLKTIPLILIIGIEL